MKACPEVELVYSKYQQEKALQFYDQCKSAGKVIQQLDIHPKKE